MRLNSLHLCNFRQHIDTRIDFETGLTGIIGPNGSGKSTILEAIAWALYGMPAARGTRETIRSYRAAMTSRAGRPANTTACAAISTSMIVPDFVRCRTTR